MRPARRRGPRSSLPSAPPRLARLAAAAVLSGLAACGDEGRSAPASAREAAPEAPAPRGERVEITPEKEAETRRNVLERRDVPLAVGARAPAFAGLPEKTVAVIVFFRGEW